MSQDISRILTDWDYDPDQISARIVRGDDGREKIQLRVELGILQMEIEGRPDGTRPESSESWLDFEEQRQQVYDLSHPDGPPFRLDEAQCMRLWREGVQYYHRYVAFWHLEQYERCARDTARTLRLFAFVRTHAEQERHRVYFDQWRPYVTMMHARAVATPLLNNKDVDQALQVIDSGIEAIQEFLDDYGQSERARECAELISLERWRDEVLRSGQAASPQLKVRALRQRLEEAVAAEEFEEAARLRDEIRRLGEEIRPTRNPGDE
jgi:hypothetical protein